MKLLYFVFAIFMWTSISYSQNDTTYEFLYVDEIPKFENNGIELAKYIDENLKLPQFFSWEDKAITSFIIDENGSICDIRIIKSYTDIFKNAVVDVLSHMPKWKPGIKNGKYVRVRLYITVEFKTL